MHGDSAASLPSDFCLFREHHSAGDWFFGLASFYNHTVDKLACFLDLLHCVGAAAGSAGETNVFMHFDITVLSAALGY
jgi:hypothetical protein